MAIWLCLHWWYGAGWEWAIKRAISERLQWCNETFSVTGLLKTLFSPFKQTYNGGYGLPKIELAVDLAMFLLSFGLVIWSLSRLVLPPARMVPVGVPPVGAPPS